MIFHAIILMGIITGSCGNTADLDNLLRRTLDESSTSFKAILDAGTAPVVAYYDKSYSTCLPDPRLSLF